MALQPCPIVGAFLREVELYMGAMPTFFDDLDFDELDELKGLASENHPNESALRLRGLYALEVMYSRLLPDAARTVSFIPEDVQRRMATSRFPRSVEGMQSLIRYLDDLKEDTEVADYAAELAGLGVDGLREWGRGQRTRWDDILTATIYSATYNESALKGAPVDSVPWERVGAQFALACVRFSLPMEDCFSYARILLRINLQNGPQPWNPTKSCPE